MTKRRKARVKRRSTVKRKSSKKRLIGYTKKSGKYAFVFKSGSKLSVGSGRFKSKNTLMKNAKKYL